jgi:Fe-S-cluster containining protein
MLLIAVLISTPSIDKGYGFPIVLLKMNNDKKHRCPFVSVNGCTVYEDRPGACRIYPLGRAASKIYERKKSDDFFFIIKEPHCLGFNEPKEWLIQDWVKDQGLDEYNTMNDFFMDIVTGKNFRRIKGLSPKQLQMFYMGCYDLDAFKNFIFKSTFMKRFEVDPDQIRRMKTDDVELMKFGSRWLNFALFGEKTLSITQ